MSIGEEKCRIELLKCETHGLRSKFEQCSDSSRVQICT